MDGRCETCKWWDAHGPYMDAEGFRAGRSVCELTRASGRSEPTHPESKAIVSGRMLWTTPDFGCVQWQAKGTDAKPN